MNLRSAPVRLSLFLLLPLLSGLFAADASASKAADRADQVKAAFILNIAKFVTWPEHALASQPGHLTLCTYKVNTLGKALATITQSRVAGRQLRSVNISSLYKLGSPGNTMACHILFVPFTELDHFKQEAERGFTQPVLTIADMTDESPSGQPHNGILVTLVRKGSSIGFEINLRRVTQVGLKMRSELLKLAQIVEASD